MRRSYCLSRIDFSPARSSASRSSRDISYQRGIVDMGVVYVTPRLISVAAATACATASIAAL
jgi:hypothetical protein